MKARQETCIYRGSPEDTRFRPQRYVFGLGNRLIQRVAPRDNRYSKRRNGVCKGGRWACEWLHLDERRYYIAVRRPGHHRKPAGETLCLQTFLGLKDILLRRVAGSPKSGETTVFSQHDPAPIAASVN